MKRTASSYCFCCGLQLDKGTDFEDEPYCYPAVEFIATGNWGSTIYDPVPLDGVANYLRIRICDACVVRSKSRIEEVGEELPDSLRDDVMEHIEKCPKVLLNIAQ